MDWRDAVALVVTVVWAMSFLAPVVLTGYAPPVELHVVFMAVLGALMGTKPDSDS